MTAISHISINDIRCFAGQNTVSLPRIAVLVGENNTGKTTFLACCSAASNLACNQNAVEYDPFNIWPFELGTFLNIARDGCETFGLGASIDGVAMSFEFAIANDTVYESRATIETSDLPELQLQRTNMTASWCVTGPGFSFDLEPDIISYQQFSQWFGSALSRQILPYSGNIDNLRKHYRSRNLRLPHFARLINHLTKLSERLPTRDVAVRALSPVTEQRHRAYTMPPVFPEAARGADTIPACERVSRAGDKLQLFSTIAVRRTPSGTYALEVDIDGTVRNIVDVGFGVHVALPILRVIGAHPREAVLIQQPESHLHPMAQALLAQLVAESEGQYLIETHADYIINRLCICVRRGELDFRDLAILWFEKVGGKAVIHRINVDQEGNLVGAPANYRAFFERETDAFLGF